jgi:predicted nucleotidyltransferase component of viral defense system
VPYESEAALRQALEARLLAAARERSIDVERLRRLAAYTRLLVRLASFDEGRWIVKGGVALELRLADRARTTRDLDLAVRDFAEGRDAGELLRAAVDRDAADGFRFAVSEPRPLAPDQLGGRGWRFHVDVRLAGRSFAAVRLDVVDKTGEVVSTELVRLPDVLGFAGIPTTAVETVTPEQHFAEKLHAFTRDYGRPNTRTRDLVDLVLLIETELVQPPCVLQAVEHVFAARGLQPFPEEIPDPPAFWAERYAVWANELVLHAQTLAEAIATVRTFWRETRKER